ncbi:hypothetical protein [Oceanobacillus kapialis]|uniref:hypothetical protein n=1 Tax=Oceanobacillus kapialis TaxID=481353 RepID=UPI00384CBD53
MLAWILIAFFAYRIYKKKTIKPKIWKVILVIIIGLISFSINFNMFETFLKFPILPLGVWILFFVFIFRNSRWQVYRSFAWLGFLANFLFLASTLLAIPIHSFIYPKGEPTTYISNTEEASLIMTHPSGEVRSLNNERLLNQLPMMWQESIESDEWYEEADMGTESAEVKERFPYRLVGTSSKWGSGLASVIYVEKDGKGILLSTPTEQLYFRSDISLIERGGAE